MGGYDPTCILIQFVCFERSLHNFATYCDRAPSPIFALCKWGKAGKGAVFALCKLGKAGKGAVFALCKWGKAGKGAVLALIVLEITSKDKVASSNHYLTNTKKYRLSRMINEYS